jgi:hypothetical protein
VGATLHARVSSGLERRVRAGFDFMATTPSAVLRARRFRIERSSLLERTFGRR